MRVATIGLVLLLCAAPLSAQPSPCTSYASGLLAFDPYNPSDLAVVRNYGGAVVAQAPLGALLKLDPYVPIEGELLRQVGSAIPWWPYTGYAWYPPVQQNVRHSVTCESVSEPPPPPLATFSDMLAALRQRTPAATAAPVATASDRNRGIGIQYAGRMWMSAGPAVPFSEPEFVRIAESAGFPIYRRAGEKDSVIYVPTTPGMVAPFRAVP